MNEENLEFVIFCIESLAKKLKINSEDAYKILKESHILDNYIIRYYNVLHTQSQQYIADDILNTLKDRGVIY